MGRAERVPPTGMSTTICLRRRGSPVGRAERVPPTGTRKSALRRWRGADIFLMSAVGRALRVPPTGTRKSSRAAHLLLFICAFPLRA